MKKYLIFLLFLAFSTMLAAQQTPRVEQLGNQKRRETYANQFGYDSMRYTILGQKDTLLAEYFANNGKLRRKEWKQDSTYVYDALGQLRVVYYDNDRTNYGNDLSNAVKDWNRIPSLTYAFNGLLRTHIYKTAKGENVAEHFNRKGILENRTVEYWQHPSVKYTVITDEEGRKTNASKIDSSTFVMDSTYTLYDTSFYANGQIATLNHYKSGEHEENYVQKYFTKEGVLFHEGLPESVRLMAFKDNVDCYYGLKNRRGDTIFKPRFDQVNLLVGDIFEAKEGTKSIPISIDGKILSTTAMTRIAPIGVKKDYGGLKYMSDNTLFYDQTYMILDAYPQYLSFKVGDKFGLMNYQGTTILPPQYPPFEAHDSAAAYFEVILADKTPENPDDNTRLVLDRQGKYLFDSRYPNVELTGIPNFFKFSKIQKTDTTQWFYVGLANTAGDVLLDAEYVKIEGNRVNGLFWVEKGTETLGYEDRKVFENPLYGIFDPKKRQWVVPCVYEMPQNGGVNIILTHSKTRKMGMISNEGQVILPFVYDTILQFQNAHLCAVAQNGRYQIYDLTNRRFGKETYQYLQPLALSLGFYTHEPSEEGIVLFVAKKKDKWGIIDFKGTVIQPFVYDYAVMQGNVALVKGNHADIFSASFFPLPDPDDVYQRTGGDGREIAMVYYLIGDKTGKVCIINPKNRVLYPPQYRIVDNNYEWQLLENDAKQRLLFFPKTETSLPFLFKKQLLWASTTSPVGILMDEREERINNNADLKIHYDIVNLKTRETYQTIQNGAVSVDHKTGTYFVKNDAPIPTPKASNDTDRIYKPYVCLDTFVVDDNNWKMFDSLGKSLNINTFRYPINFIEGVGIGAVGNKFGVWRTNGTAVIPPQYDNAHWESSDASRIILYQNIGLKNWLLLAEGETGKIRIGTGRYDGISDFYGKYALVSLGDKIGLVDTLGREIIAPTALQNEAVNFMDSLNLINLEARRQFPAERRYSLRQSLPITFFDFGTNNSPDSLALPNALRNRVWHYLLETQVGRCIRRADFKEINRGHAFKTYSAYEEQCNGVSPVNMLHYLFADSLHISFALVADSAAKSVFKNYWQTKTGWQTKQLSDILNLSRDNIIKINDLLRQKIKQLENTEIDCGESSSFVERTRNSFLSHAKGISFYFTADSENGQFHYVPIMLTWAELKGFLN